MQFVYHGVDDPDNESERILCENQFQVYQGDLPPLMAPTGLVGQALSGGKIKLSWDEVEGAGGYELYRQAPGENELTVYARIEDALEYTDEPTIDGLYLYAIASICQENGQESVSGVSASVEVLSDSVSPDAPLNLELELVSQGIAATWEANSYTEVVTYSLYRSDAAEITSVEGLTPVITEISGISVIDPTPSPAEHCYVVTAVDQCGNESLPSNSFYLNFDLLPLSTLSVRQVDNDPPVVSWTHPGGNIAGYNIYLGPEDEIVKLNQDILSDFSYADTGYRKDERQYTVVAVDNNDQESLGRTLTLPLLSATLNKGEKIHRGLMNCLEYVVENRSLRRIDHVRLNVQIDTYAHTSEIFSIDPSTSRAIMVTVAGYADLPDVAALSTTIEITPNKGEKVEIVRSSEIEVIDGMLVLNILNEEFIRGGTGSVRFTLENTGEEEIEIVTAVDSGSGASDEINLFLLDSDGNVLSTSAYKQNLGEDVVTLANDKTLARIPAGNTFASVPLQIFVPPTPPDDLTLCLEISHIHYHHGESEQVTMEGLSTTLQVSLVDTSYYGEVLNITPESSNGDEDIIITGQAAERGSDLPLPEVPLNLVISVNGFDRTYKIFTGNDGGFSFTFTPLLGEFGTYTVRAVHPELNDKPVQEQFEINQVIVDLPPSEQSGINIVRPSTINLNVPRNYEQAISIHVTAGGNPAHNVRLVYDALEQPEGVLPQGVHVNPGSPIAVLEAGQSASLNWTIWADNTAAEAGTIILKIESDEINGDPWGTITVNMHFSKAGPALYFSPDHLETGLALDETVSETIVLENRGFADLQDVTLAVVKMDGTPAPAWVSLNCASDKGDISVGEECEVSISFSPTSSATTEGMYSFYLRVSSSNYPETNILLFVAVTQSGIGNVLFKVSVYTGTIDPDSGEIVQGMAGAKIRVQNENVLTVDQTQTSDSLGEVLFNDLPAGRYKCRITAGDHQEYIGRFWIKPGITVNKEVFLASNLVTVEWEVTETTIEDQYEIVLTTAYETDVPAAVLVAEPASVTLPDMKAGDVYRGEFTLTNYGLIRADEIQYLLPQDDRNFKYELMTGLPDSLGPKERITVPYRVTCLNSLDQEEETGSGGGCTSYKVCIVIPYGFICENGAWYLAWTKFCFTQMQCSGLGSGIGGGHGGVTGGEGWAGVIPGGGSGGGSQTIVVSPGQPTGGDNFSPPGSIIDGVYCGPDRVCQFFDICCLMEGRQDANSHVHLLRGEYEDEVTDLFVKVPGYLLQVKRYYFDRMWHFKDEAQHLEFIYGVDGDNPDSIKKDGVVYEMADTTRTVFSYRSDQYIFLIDNGYRWEDGSGFWNIFDLEGRLISYGDRNGFNVSFIYEPGEDGKLIGVADSSGNQVFWYEYNNEGTISSVHDASGRKVEYYYDSGKLSKVVDILGNEVYYYYDAKGKLESKVDPEGRTTHISYYNSGVVSGITDQNGIGLFFDYIYDPGAQEIYASVRFSSGKIKEVWYDQFGKLIRTDINGRTVEKIINGVRNKIKVDANGNNTHYEYDEWGNLIRKTYPDGSMELMEYDLHLNEILKKIDRSGTITEYKYDDVGNMVRKTEAAGSANERLTEFTYDVFGNQLTMKLIGDENTDEAITTMEYDEFGNMESITDPEGNTTCFTHDIMGNILTKEDPRGKIWHYEYDDAGRLEKTTDPLENEVQYFYDAVGNKVKKIDPIGKETKYVYDHHNRLIESIAASGNSTYFQYNSDGKLIKHTDPEGKEINNEYDLDGRLAKKIDGNGNEIVYEYEDTSELPCPTCSGGSAGDQATRIIYPSFSIERKYDIMGEKIEEKTVLSETEEYISLFEYDISSNVVAETDKEGRTTFFEYDELDRKVKETDSPGNELEYTYDDQSNLIGLRDANGNLTQFEYDRNNWLKKEIRPMGEETTYQYDGAGSLIEKIDAKNQKIEYEYDDAGRLNQIRYFSETDYSTPVKTVTFTHDDGGHLEAYNDGITFAQYEYDDSYRKIAETVNYGLFELTYEYDYYKNGRKKSFTGPDGISYEYKYDANNQLTEVQIPEIGSITYNSYTWNRPDNITLPGGSTREYEYDSLMRPTSITVKDPAHNIFMDYQYTYDGMNNILTQKTEHGAYSYEYDPVYRLKKADNPILEDEGYEYDATGNRLAASGVSGVWSYNGNNELIGYNDNSFEYDNNGNMVVKNAGGDITGYVFDIENRLVRVEGSDNTIVAEYYYDPFGRRLWKEVDGVRTFFLYSDEGLVGEYNSIGSENRTYSYKLGSIWTRAPLFMKVGNEYYFYQNDHSGTPMQMTGINGGVVWSAPYDSFGKAQVEPSSVISNSLRLPGQYYDAETGLHYNYFRNYNPQIGRYIETDPLGMGNRPDIRKYLAGPMCPKGYNDMGINLYVYAHNNPINSIDPFGTFGVSLHFETQCFPFLGWLGVKVTGTFGERYCCDCESNPPRNRFMTTLEGCLELCIPPVPYGWPSITLLGDITAGCCPKEEKSSSFDGKCSLGSCDISISLALQWPLQAPDVDSSCDFISFNDFFDKPKLECEAGLCF